MHSLSLLREKFTIRDLGTDGSSVIALGNRMQVGLPKETIPLVVRGHSMHMTLKYVAEILKHLSYISHVENIETLLDWEKLWEKITTPYEAENVPDTWICIYFKGKILFQFSHHHTFFDVIERAEYKNIKSSFQYEKSIIVAQNAFRQMGRSVMIDQESHVGFVLDPDPKEMRFAIILRTPEQKATFIVRMSVNKKYNLHPYDYVCLQLAADYIEGINMAVRAGFLEKDISSGLVSEYSDAGKLYKKILKRLKTTETGINSAENKYTVRYRPEKPDFKIIQKECLEN